MKDKPTYLDQLKSDGIISIKNVFNSELDPLKAFTNDLIKKWYNDEVNGSDFWNYYSKEYGKMLYRIQNFERYFDVSFLAQHLSFSKLILEIFKKPLKPNCCALIIKMPNCNGVPWHRDIANINPHRKYNFSIFLDPAFPENGCIEALVSSHLNDIDYSDKTSAPANSSKMPIAANDIIVHDVKLFHGSGPSCSNQIRRSLILEFGD